MTGRRHIIFAVLFASLVQVVPAASESNGGEGAAAINVYNFLKGINASEPNVGDGRQNLTSYEILKEDSKQELNTADAARNLIVYDADGNSTATVIPVPYGCGQSWDCGIRNGEFTCWVTCRF